MTGCGEYIVLLTLFQSNHGHIKRPQSLQKNAILFIFMKMFRVGNINVIAYYLLSVILSVFPNLPVCGQVTESREAAPSKDTPPKS